MKTINLSFKEEIIERADAVAKARGMSRSDFVREAVETLINNSASTFSLENDLSFADSLAEADFNNSFRDFWQRFVERIGVKSYQLRTVSEALVMVDDILADDLRDTVFRPMTRMGWLPELVRVLMQVEDADYVRREIIAFILSNWEWVISIYNLGWLMSAAEEYWQLDDMKPDDLRFPEEYSMRLRVTELLKREYEQSDHSDDILAQKKYNLLKRLVKDNQG